MPQGIAKRQVAVHRVPNVVYSCGAMPHSGRLFIPYGISDTTCSLAWVDMDELLDAIK